MRLKPIFLFASVLWTFSLMLAVAKIAGLVQIRWLFVFMPVWFPATVSIGLVVLVAIIGIFLRIVRHAFDL